MQRLEPCPKCGSNNVARLLPEDMSMRKTASRFKELQKTGIRICYVSPSDYTNYYLPFSINEICMDCKYEFNGTSLLLEDDKEIKAYKEELQKRYKTGKKRTIIDRINATLQKVF